MIARTHDLAAISALVIVSLSMPIQEITLSTAIVAIVANLIGGVAPDIDQPTAPFWRNLPVGGYFGRIIAKMLGGHRFLTHSLLGAAILSYLVYLLLGFLRPIMGSVNIDIVWWAFVIGLMSHLVLDTFNKEGVPWLLPIPIKFGFPPLKAFRISTDSWVESWLVFPAIILIDILVVFANYQHILFLIHNKIM
ncbi:metal-dependent hydrolase [Candidatus Saccharibacteria bacterium]|nr:metal-dependent hydrolase [Candidatus Saccharibacteria bacterium]